MVLPISPTATEIKSLRYILNNGTMNQLFDLCGKGEYYKTLPRVVVLIFYPELLDSRSLNRFFIDLPTSPTADIMKSFRCILNNGTMNQLFDLCGKGKTYKTLPSVFNLMIYPEHLEVRSLNRFFIDK